MEKKRSELRSLKDLIPRDYSFKFYTQEQDKLLRQSVLNIGVIRPIVIAGDYIVDGQRLYLAAKSVGITQLWCEQLGEAKECQRIKIYTQINHINADVDWVSMSKVVNKLNDGYSVNQIAKILGYDLEQVKNLLKLMHFNWEDFAKNEAIDENQVTLF